MPDLFEYILKLSISVAMVYLFYHFALRKLTFYSWNRWYLLGYSFFSFFIAFLNITPLFRGDLLNYNKAMQFVPAIDFYRSGLSSGKSAVAIGHGDWDNWTVCLFILIMGALILAIRLVIQYFSFLRVRRKAELLSGNDTKIYHVEADIIPFSFGNSIFLNKQLHSFDELQDIVRHEFVHVKQKHTIDILWSEMLCVINWYNPFSWLLKRSIRQNLEFIADNKVLENGMNKKEYQYLLLKVIGNNHFSIASKFNFSSLKKRIAMMNKIKTARVHILKFLFILPLVAVLLIAFRKQDHPVKIAGARLENVPRTLTLSPASFTYSSDTLPKTGTGKKQPGDRASDHFEITDKKAVIHLRNGKTEEYDLTDSAQRRNFEVNYGKIISVSANADEPAPVSIVTETGETVTVSRPVVVATMAPVAATTNVSPVITAKIATISKTSISTVLTPVASTKSVTAIDDGYPVLAEDVLVTITKNTTAGQLEEFKKQMKERGYELIIGKTTYSDKGLLTHISGTIKSQDGTGKFSATDFERVILARIQENNQTYFRIEIVDKKKLVI